MTTVQNRCLRLARHIELKTRLIRFLLQQESQQPQISDNGNQLRNQLRNRLRNRLRIYLQIVNQVNKS